MSCRTFVQAVHLSTHLRGLPLAPGLGLSFPAARRMPVVVPEVPRAGPVAVQALLWLVGDVEAFEEILELEEPAGGDLALAGHAGGPARFVVMFPQARVLLQGLVVLEERLLRRPRVGAPGTRVANDPGHERGRVEVEEGPARRGRQLAGPLGRRGPGVHRDVCSFAPDEVVRIGEWMRRAQAEACVALPAGPALRLGLARGLAAGPDALFALPVPLELEPATKLRGAHGLQSDVAVRVVLRDVYGNRRKRFSPSLFVAAAVVEAVQGPVGAASHVVLWRCGLLFRVPSSSVLLGFIDAALVLVDAAARVRRVDVRPVVSIDLHPAVRSLTGARRAHELDVRPVVVIGAVVRARGGVVPQDHGGSLYARVLVGGLVDHVLREVQPAAVRVGVRVVRGRAVLVDSFPRVTEEGEPFLDLDLVLDHVLRLVHRDAYGAEASSEAQRHAVGFRAAALGNVVIRDQTVRAEISHGAPGFPELAQLFRRRTPGAVHGRVEVLGLRQCRETRAEVLQAAAPENLSQGLVLGDGRGQAGPELAVEAPALFALLG
mmetsp:Transcript_20897/g.62339  ORF Transcript_20897/g.62339 Transcript_20897/m.62339 type:complete len:547 (-) Transcript_20897:571-2211(-)